MKMSEAREYIADYRLTDGKFNEEGLAELLIWAYDKGCSDGMEDYREEQDPTEEQEWRRTR